jgi:uncharacterized protein YndB with AHSA1/START domain
MGRPFRVFRSRLLHASPAEVFAVVNDFSRWKDWSPYYRRDPEAVLTPSGPSAGKGAVLEWRGKQSGAGRMELLHAVPNERVEARVDFQAPMKATHLITWEMSPAEGGGTEFAWTMTGEQPWFLALAMRLFRLDRTLAAQFDEGMDHLAALLDAAAKREG